jgi:hypothetical protein
MRPPCHGYKLKRAHTRTLAPNALRVVSLAIHLETISFHLFWWVRKLAGAERMQPTSLPSKHFSSEKDERVRTTVGALVAVYAPGTAHYHFYIATTLSHPDGAKR